MTNSSHNPPPAYAPPSIVTDRSKPAWLLSLLLHTILFVVMMMAFNATRTGVGEIENRTGGIVLVDINTDSTKYLSEGDVLDASEPAPKEQSPPPISASAELPPDLPGLETNPTPITGVGNQLVESLPGADSLLDGGEPNLEIGGKITTDVFGVKGTGSRFVYVFDRSKSMEGFQGRPLMAARQELLKSLRSLSSNHQFQVIFYNDDVRLFKPESLSSLHFATDENKSAATQFVNSIRGDRGTDHLNALNRAFRLGPEVIFLLTDAEGGFTQSELREAAANNRSAAIINAIEFGERRGGDRSLEALARQSGGQYLFKDIRSLRLDK